MADHECEIELTEQGKSTADAETSSLLPTAGPDAPPDWRCQLTPRALLASFLLALLFSLVSMRLNLTTGIVPSLSASAGLLGFFLLSSWTAVLRRGGWATRAFTPQENTAIQTCVVAASGIAFSGGFGSYLFGMSGIIAKQTTELNDAQNIKNPHFGWMIGFLFIVSFLGLFSLVPLTKIMIIDFKLMYPSGTATAQLINSLHTPQGAKLAKKQMKALSSFFSLSIIWDFIQWFYTGGEGCGFKNFPLFGLTAYKNKFYFDFSATYIGVGMICPYMVNVSVLLGSIISWGIMWPLISLKKGSWYPADLNDNSLHGLQGYKVFIAIAMILGDGIYNLLKIAIRTISSFLQHSHYQLMTTSMLPSSDNATKANSVSSLDAHCSDLFLRDQIPKHIAFIGYGTISALSSIVLPHIFHPLKWYHILVAYATAPLLAFSNAYGCGLTDWSLASTYGKLAIFTVGAWVGASHGGVLAGLAACGVIMSIVSTASDLMQDFKTGYLTLSSPRSMFLAQLAGTAMGCIISPSIFLLLYAAFPSIGDPSSDYPSPYALIYRNMALLGVEGFHSLPLHCLDLCCVFFSLAILLNLLRDLAGEKIGRFVPVPTALAIPFYLGGYFAIDMCLGSVIMYVWGIVDGEGREALATAVASGMVCGDGVWALPESLLALAGVRPPICMRFLSREENRRLEQSVRL